MCCRVHAILIYINVHTFNVNVEIVLLLLQSLTSCLGSLSDVRWRVSGSIQRRSRRRSVRAFSMRPQC